MNCPRNDQLVPSDNFILSDQGPPEVAIPEHYACEIYSPITLDGQEPVPLPAQVENDIQQFIAQQNRTATGNVTELPTSVLARIKSTPSAITVLTYKRLIIGTMFSLILRCAIDGTEVLSSYITFLCVNKVMRKKGLAMIMIRCTLQEGYRRYGINHGYYMTETVHHDNHSPLTSWYRPLNIKRARSAGFQIPTFILNNKGSRQTRRMTYSIGRPGVLPTPAIIDDYSTARKILATGKFALAPTEDEWSMLCQCFDIYLVQDYGLFFLFPAQLTVQNTGQKVYLAELVLMIGDCLSQVLWIVKDKYDLLYGWCIGDITGPRVSAAKGINALSNVYLEWYNSHLVAVADAKIPVF